MKKPLAAAVLAVLAAGSGAALARPPADVARVLSATPVYETVAPARPACWNERVTAYEAQRVVVPGPVHAHGSGAGTVLGAVVGGVIGHQFGGSSGARDRATAAGAIIGGLVGHDIDRQGGYHRAGHAVVTRNVPVTRVVERCEAAPARQALVGYDVRYAYRGQHYATRLAYDPGPTLAVDVHVRPADRRPARPSTTW